MRIGEGIVILVSVLGVVSGVDLCYHLCWFDGEVCAGASYTKPNGFCHGYVYRGDPSAGEYCYHTAASAAECPGSGPGVLASDAAELFYKRVAAGTAPESARRTVAAKLMNNPNLMHEPTEAPTTTAPHVRTARERLRARMLLIGADFAQFGMEPERELAFMQAVPILNGPVRLLRSGIRYVQFATESLGRGPGAIRDWFTEVTSQIFSPSTGLFALRESYTVINETCVHHDEFMEYFRAVGGFLALSLVEETPIGATFPVMFYAKLLNATLTLEDIEEDEPALYRSFNQVLLMSADELDGLDISIGNETIALTVANRAEVISRKINSLMDPTTERQLDAVVSSFGEVIPPNLLSDLFSPTELRNLVRGDPVIDVEDMISHATLEGYQTDSLQIHWLWNLVRSFDQANLSAFLRFLTGATHLPVGGFAIFGNVTIERGPHFTAQSLPESHTCFNRLTLPPYADEATLRTRVQQALDYGGGMAFM